MTTAELQDYQTFLTSIQPVAVGLNSSAARIDRVAFANAADAAGGMLSAVHSIEAEYRLSETDEDWFDVVGRILVKSRPKTDDSIELFSVEAVFEAHFHAAKGFAREHAERFADAEAKLILWPYFREMVANVGSRMGIPPPMLPLAFRPSDIPSRPSSDKSPARSSDQDP